MTFLCPVYIHDTSAATLVTETEDIPKYGLSKEKLCRQCYDGARDMRAEFRKPCSIEMSGLFILVGLHLSSNLVCCPTLVAIGRNHSRMDLLFNKAANISNVVRALTKRDDILRKGQPLIILGVLYFGETSNMRNLVRRVCFSLGKQFLLKLA